MRSIHALALVLALLSTGCLTRTLREPVYERGGIDVFLRSQKKSGEPIDRGYDQIERRLKALGADIERVKD